MAVLKSTKTNGRPCPICSHVQSEVLHKQTFVLPENHPLANGYDVVACERCGFVFADTRVNQKDYDRFYASHSKYEDNRTSTGGGGSALDAARLKETAATISQHLPDRTTCILDIGCANGGLLKALRELGYSRLWGLDPSPGCADYARRVNGLEAHAGTLSELPAAFAKNEVQFQCVILSHVLEHVSDLKQAVGCIGHLTGSGGVVYVEVPDASRYAELVIAPFQDFNTEHINHFSSLCLGNLFGQSGWVSLTEGRKTLYASPNMPYPAVYRFFVRADGSAPAPAIQEDKLLRDQVRTYVVRSREIMDRIKDQLSQVLAADPEVLVWGTGQLAMKLLAETPLARARITAFVDSNPIHHGQRLHGRPILAPDQIRTRSQPIIVASMLHGPAIERTIRQELELPNPIIQLR